MPTKLFERGNEYARKGGLAKRGCGVIDTARAWINENGVEKAIEWVNGPDSANARFALGILFTYALGKPKETIEVNSTFETIMAIKNDPRLDELIDGFARWNNARHSGGNHRGLLVEGSVEVQDSSASDQRV